jgi:hypothetical protein
MMRASVFALLCLLQSASAFYAPTMFKSMAQQASAVIPKLRASRLLKMVISDKAVKMDAPKMGGMFTNSSPDTKRVVPANAMGKTKFKIVYVVLESQYQSSLTKACNSINDGTQGVAVEAVGYLLEELRSPAVLEQFKADVADANIFIGSLIFVQELADKVR